ncbi:MAG: hypothetical protein M3Q71_03645 [Chloroflexota bacterium]|nr:hypothetical protein [Chloroflexota bacterium]MDP9469748.1 hypothetical protein [Chloroflexota bacterium]
MMGEGSDWNAGLEPIEPMVEYYAREMGQLGGRLMAALSLLVDLEDSYGWDSQSAQARETVRYSRLLVASVLRIVAAAQAEQGDETGMAGAIDAGLQRLFAAQNGGEGGIGA